MNTIIAIIIVLLIALVAYSYNRGISIMQAIDSLCGGCVQKIGCANCPACNMARDTSAIFKKFAMGCSKQLRGVVTADMVQPTEIKDFLGSGKHKLVLIANVKPDILVTALSNGKTLDDIKIVTISSSVVGGQKVYLIMSVINGQLSPVGSPTVDYTEASKYFTERVEKDVGPASGTIVMFIDEDISCDVPTGPAIEKCCGRRV